jgi:methionyl-tRNA formyltransferase
MPDMTLRIVVLTSFLGGYQVVADWAARHGHEIVLVVSPPVEAGQRYDGNPLVLSLPSTANILITGKLRTVAASVIATAEPDLVISAAFPRLIPAEILDIPKYGAINCHPSALPIGRGPNPARLIYEGDDQVAVTVHRTAAEFDTGAILAQRTRPLPDDLNGPIVFKAWQVMLGECLDFAVPRAVAGEPGLWQNPDEATEAPFFTPEELLIDLTEPAQVVRRKVAALNVVSPQAQAEIPGVGLREVLATYAVPASGGSTKAQVIAGCPDDWDERCAHKAGTVLERHADGWTVQTADRPLRLICRENS